MMFNIFFLYFIHFVFRCIDCQTLTLQTLTSPDGCYGGQICQIQPSVVVINKATRQIEYGFVGDVYVQIGTSPIGYETLYVGNTIGCDLLGCGQKVFGTVATAVFVKGVATFQKLYIKESGYDYTLNFVGRTSNGALFAQTMSNPFNVYIGEPYKLAFKKFIGAAFGGIPFSENPTIAVVDRGDNTISSYNTGTIIATLTKGPDNSTDPISIIKEKLLPQDLTIVNIVDGLAVFEGLYINEAGHPYEITFDISSPNALLSGRIVSPPFDVIIGPVAKLAFISGYEPGVGYTSIYAGEYFSVPPKIQFLDAGGNPVSQDSTSGVLAYINNNPVEGAFLGPRENTFAIASNGIVTFTAININKQGFNYTLLFTVFNYSALDKQFFETSVSLMSAKFQVDPGFKRRLVLVEPASGAWAGGQAFTNQPLLQIQDYGGNVLKHDFTSVVRASMVESLSVNSDIVIYTADAPISRCKDIYIPHLINSSYGAGQVIDIIMAFDVHVWVKLNYSSNHRNLSSNDIIHDENLPYLILNVKRVQSIPTLYGLPTDVKYGLLQDNYAIARLIGVIDKTKMLAFRYKILQGDNTNGSALDYIGIDALKYNNSIILDGNGNAIESILPYPGIATKQNIVVDTTAPVVVAISTNTSDGEYGAGQVIDLYLSFDKPVYVEGYPYLSLSSNNASFNSEYNFTNIVLNSTAIYSHSSDDNKTLHFFYTVQEFDNTDTGSKYLTVIGDNIQFMNFSSNITWAIWRNKTFLGDNTTFPKYEYTYNLSNYLTGSIKRYSTNPTTFANYNIARLHTMFLKNHKIVIDTSSPILDPIYGVRSNHTNGTYYPGEHIYLTVRFNKPVVTFGAGIALKLNAGPHLTTAVTNYIGYAYIHLLHEDCVTMEFLYVVESNVNISRLDLAPGNSSLAMLGKSAFIRRKSTHPIKKADVSSFAIYNSFHSLKHTSALKVYGFAPVVSKVELFSTQPPNVNVLYPDNFALIKITFSAPVYSICKPVLVMMSKFYREATYVSGNGSDAFIFNYTILVGDETQRLQYRHTPNALCSVSGCPYKTNCNLLAASTVPSLPINLILPRIENHFIHQGVPINNQNVQIDGLLQKRPTKIISVKCLQESGVYGAGSVFRFEVLFSDIVVVNINLINGSSPVLHLSLDKYAYYSGGSRTTKLLFTYISTVDDIDINFKASNIPQTDHALECNSVKGCLILNQANKEADLNTTYTSLISNGITLDPTPPRVTKVWSTKKTSPYKDSDYSVGERIYIYVETSEPVLVTGFNPRIVMNVSQSERYANYVSKNSTSTLLVFLYSVIEGDYSPDLTYLIRYIDLYGGGCKIYRSSSIPTTLMNITLPYPEPIAENNQIIRINTFEIPKVLRLNVLQTNLSTLYAGDSLIIRVEFSIEVIAIGRSYIQLNFGDHNGRAYYVGYNSGRYAINSSPTEFSLYSYNTASNASRYLYYQYDVQENDYTGNLDYVDVFSLLPGITYVNDQGMIVHASSLPRLKANLELPQPGSQGSLSSGDIQIKIDGRAPYLTRLFYVNLSGTYSVHDSICFGLEFSAAVYLTGGIPTIKMETGLVDNFAFYVNGSGTNVLYFVYHPEPGDHSVDLDYHSERSLFSSAINTFQYNGAVIMAYSANPYLNALIWLNPPFGFLESDLTESPYPIWSSPATPIGGLLEPAIGGVIQFNDLKISRRGPDYLVRYSTEANHEIFAGVRTIFSTSQNISVSFSSELQLVPKLAKKTQLVGHKVDIDGDIAILGCPNCNISVFTIQTVTTSASEDPITREVQLIRTYVLPQPAIQSFHTTADVGEVVGGFYRIMIGQLGPTRGIPANADPDIIQAIMKFDLPSLGNITVTQKPYIYCACENAFIWEFTFNDVYEGVLSPLVFDTSMLTGSKAAIIGPKIIQSPALLGGTFTLSAFNLTTLPISYDAGVSEIVNAIAELGIPVFDVFITPTEPSGSRSWSVTFDAYLDSYEIPLLQSNGSELTGGETSLFVQISRPGKHGPYGISGYFALKLRGDTTELIPSHADAALVKSALESLPTVNFVNVERTTKTLFHGYTWTIEFVEMMEHTTRGLVLQETSNVEPLQFVNQLIATNATITVEAKFNIGSGNHIFSSVREGSYGAGAGAVHIFQRHNETWDEMATIRARDTVENSRFGSSIAILGDVIIVGAEGANLDGLPEKQSIFCSATSGSFIINFRGWQTNPINYNVTRQELINAMISDSRIFSNLYTIRSIDIDDWGGGSLCDNNTAIITFYSPISGDEVLLGADTGPDLEPLSLDIFTLKLSNNVTGVLLGAEVQKGSWIEYGVNADKQQFGAAYIFRASYDCIDENIEHCYKNNWIQEAKLFPPTYSAGSRFGYSVALSGNVALVGAPGSLDERGAVYAFEYNQITKTWSYVQQLILVDEFAGPGDHFGSSLAISGDTVVVAALNYINNTGGVFIFSRPVSSGSFIVAQSLGVTLLNSFPLNSGDLFGMDITIEGDYVLVGSPGFSDKSVYLGDVPSPDSRTKSGTVFSFRRQSSFYNFYFFQKLEPSNVKEFDGFGYSLRLNGKNLIVSSLQDYDGDLISNAPVVEIRTSATYNTVTLSGSFKIKWLHSLTMQFLETRLIPFDASAQTMKHILQSDLPTGPLMVSRSPVDENDGGYSWSVTFMHYEGQVTLFDSDTTLLAGVNATVTSRFVNKNPTILRGKAHIFQRISIDEPFVEQMFLSPFSHQPMDRCGQSVSISGRYALMGCPNRDLHVPGQNSGAGFIFDLGLLAVQFNEIYTVKEGNQAQIKVVHDNSNILNIDDDLYFYVRTLDRNSYHEMQIFIKDLFGLSDPTNSYPYSMMDRSLLVGKAVARAQYYGSLHNESKWVDGMYDYRAISDYVPINNPQVFVIEANEINDFVITTDDTILEVPDEYIILGITSPGIWPSVFGRLYGQIRIYDPMDGTLRGRVRYSKLYDSMSIHTEGISESSTAASISSTSKVINKASTNSAFGTAIALNDEIGVMMVSAPTAQIDGRENAGKVLFYRRGLDGNWTQQTQYFTSPLAYLKGNNFGADVALSRLYDRNISILAIGEPSLNKVYVYSSMNESFGIHYNLEVVLSPVNSYIVQERFGDKNTIAIDGYILVVASPGLESIMVYRRIFNLSSNSWKWTDGLVLHSSDYDYDIINGIQIQHRQEFGSSVAIDQNTILVGAPFADYDKLASNLVEADWNTEGSSILSYGKGKAYLFYSSPSSQEILIDSLYQLRYGQFKLKYIHQGITQTTDILNFDIFQDDFLNALMKLDNIDKVEISSSNNVNISDSGRFYYSWTITFISDWEDEVSLLEPLWFGFGCSECSEFSFSADHTNMSTLNASLLIHSKILSLRLPFQELQTLSANDRRNGDRFGEAVAIDGDQIVIGAPNSCGMTTTTWDFEAGSLLGWHSTGDAFEFQPTFGDNSYLRSSHSGQKGSEQLRAQRLSSGLSGRYYIGTYEKRPGDPLNYQVPNSFYPEGNIQGDGPRGMLSSDIFIIRGSQISFLIGGGCDPYLIFVELLIDGLSVAKQTGQCNEKMKSAFFDVSLFYNRAAQIRIVDNSTANWGHINVDDFQFSWNIAGATIPGINQKTTTGGVLESAYSGVAYLYYRGENCDNVDKNTCKWIQEAKFSASDKRSNMKFGSSVALNSTAGTVYVGAKSANLTGFYKEVPSVYPFINSSGSSTVANLPFPIDPKYMQLFQSLPLYLPERSGSNAIWSLLDLFNSTKQLSDIADERVSEGAGAVYVYIKKHKKTAANGEIIVPHYWSSTEHAKIQLLDGAARDGFGASISLSNNLIAFGATGQDGLVLDSGAVYIYSTEFASISFSQPEYPVLECTDVVAITLLRDLSIYSGSLAIEYATSDLSAKGIDDAHFQACLKISVKQRNAANCGDYLLTSGVVYIPEGVTSGGFIVKIMNDQFYESFQEYIQLTLSIPGSAGLQSDILSARIRIDDDDFEQSGSI